MSFVKDGSAFAVLSINKEENFFYFLIFSFKKSPFAP